MRRVGWAVLALLVCLACEPARDPSKVAAETSDYVEQPGVRRVVSTSPAASRFVLAIGAADLLVGVDAISGRIPELRGTPIVDLARAADLDPDLVLVPEIPPEHDPAALALRDAAVDVVEFTPHDLEDAFDLCRVIGIRLVGGARAHRFEAELSRPLAAISGDSFGRLRPRVVAVVGFDPVEIAGGHSFETDLIEMAGGTSVTHAQEQPRMSIAADGWSRLAPDLIWVVSPDEMTPEHQTAARERLPDDIAVSFFAADTEAVWLVDPVDTARRFRAVIEPVSRELENRQGLRERGGS
jgi:ABC-type Fe3+-hydroxamate transport system substrate-binding protein